MLSFIFDFLLCAALIYIPGCILFAFLRCNLLSTVTLAPLPTLTYYALAAQVFSLIHLPATMLSLGGSCLVFFVIVGFIVNRVSKRSLPLLRIAHDPISIKGKFHISFSLLCIVLFLGVGLGLYSYLFCRNVDAPDMFLQNYDNITHLARIRLFADTGDFGSLSAGLYDFTQNPATRPTTYTGSFYPSLWHSIGALTFGLLGGSLTTLVNALNGVFVAIVFPLSMLGLFAALFPQKPRLILCGALTIGAFEAFPWGYLTFGPLYPNLASLSILPAVWALFIVALQNRIATRARVSAWVFFGCGVISLIFLQPNALFTSVIGLSAFCVYKILREPPAWNSLQAKSRRRFWTILFVIFVIAFWFLCYNLPFFANIVAFDNWRAIASKRQVIIDVLTLALADCPSQLWLGVLVLIGCVAAWRERQMRWMVVSYGLFAIFYAVCASFEGTFKHILCGFWYCDPYRFAAHMPLLGAPLAALGLSTLIESLQTRLSQRALDEKPTHAQRQRRRTKHALSPRSSSSLAVVLVTIVLVFYPNFAIKGLGEVQTAFGFFEEKVQDCSNDSISSKTILPVDEQRFLEKVAELVPEDALVLNNPYDGSVFAYGLNGLNMYYRYVIDYGLDDETEASLTIRHDLNDMSSRAEVAHAVASTGADYLLLLDVNNPKLKKETFDVYQPDEWKGLTSITDATDGFIPILSEGDMRLYRIDPTKVRTQGAPTNNASLSDEANTTDAKSEIEASLESIG